MLIDTHLQNVDVVLAMLQKPDLLLNLRKYFFIGSTENLKHIIRSRALATYEARTKIFKHIQHPQKVAKV